MPFDELVPIVAIVMVFGIPIVAILTAHQRKMAEMFNRQHADSAQGQEVAALRHEVAQLRQIVAAQTIALDTLRNQQAQSSEALRQTLSER